MRILVVSKENKMKWKRKNNNLTTHTQHTPWFFIEMRHVKRIQQGIYKWNFICFFPSMLFIIFTLCFLSLSSIHPCFGCSISRRWKKHTKNHQHKIRIEKTATKYGTEWNETKRQHASCIRGFYLFMDWMCNLYGFHTVLLFLHSFVLFFRVCVLSRWWLEYCFSNALVLFICLGWLVLSAQKFWYTTQLLQYRMHHCVCITISTTYSIATNHSVIAFSRVYF